MLASGWTGRKSAVLALVVTLSLWAFLQIEPARPAAAKAARVAPDRGDVALYREVARRVRAGKSYYAAAADLHRQRRYPLKPFFAVRLPTLAWLAAGAGIGTLVVAAWGLLLAAIFAWHRRLRHQPLAQRLAAVGLLALAGAPLISSQSVLMHELWCGLLLTVALAFDPRREWGWQLGFVALALAIREFAAPFLALMLAAAVVDRDRKRILAVTAVAVAFAALLLLHRDMVNSVATPADGSSAGWLGLRGPLGFVQDLRAFSWLLLVPERIAVLLAFLPLLGWSALRRGANFALLWFLGFGLVVAAFARPNNLYWIVVLLPAYFLGFALLPRFLSRARHPHAGHPGPFSRRDRNQDSINELTGNRRTRATAGNTWSANRPAASS